MLIATKEEIGLWVEWTTESGVYKTAKIVRVNTEGQVYARIDGKGTEVRVPMQRAKFT